MQETKVQELVQAKLVQAEERRLELIEKQREKLKERVRLEGGVSGGRGRGGRMVGPGREESGGIEREGVKLASYGAVGVQLQGRKFFLASTTRDLANFR